MHLVLQSDPGCNSGANFIATLIFPHLAIHGTNQFAQTQVQQHNVHMLRYTRKIPQAKALKNHNMLKQKKNTNNYSVYTKNERMVGP